MSVISDGGPGGWGSVFRPGALGAPAGMCQITRRRSYTGIVQPSRSLLSWTARVDGTRTMCRGPATCRQRSMIAMVRVLTGSPSAGALECGRGWIDAHHREGTRQEHGKDRFRRHLSSDPAPAAHKVVLENAHPGRRGRAGTGVLHRAGLRAEGHAVTVCHDGESGEAAGLTGDYALVLLGLLCPAGPGATCLERSPWMPEPASDRADRARSRRAERGLDRGAEPGRVSWVH